MDLFGRFRKLDSSLQRGLDNGFARVFGGEVVPAEIDELLKQQAESSVMMDPDGHRWAPCHFMVNVSKRDYNSLLDKHENLEADLSDRLQRYIRNSGWQTYATVTVTIDSDESLHSGQLKANSMFNAPPARRRQSEERSTERSQDSNPSSSHSRSSSPASDPSSSSHSSDANSGLSNIVREAPGSGYYVVTHRPEAREEAGASEGHHTKQQEQPAQQDRADAQWTRDNEQPQERDPQPSATHLDSNRPVSYPGTEVMAENLHKEEPVTGASSEPNEQRATVTLILRDGSDRKYVLHEGSNLIGRGNGVDLRIPDTGVSRQHAEIAWDGYDAVLTDLQSTNGTSVNETPIENWLLADGDIIVMGHSEIEVQFRD
ncbi:DUF3662 and FHA domain-containing protein [Corynebacterium anserum]|uniref:DUF3662 domain-containing protein n=1 Tax=Corynebacterium anserum TaxID=2684406 RepID=A0A7G7YLG2_9CORY|nr:DUF3662 and FHA domain-containing protein [Corynebacterium anserum]QNH95332.1 DUF3662 domain-containing protein [Corynebacterium anserum]